MEAYVGLHKTRGLISRAIRWQTRGTYSHASLIFVDPTSSMAIEAWHRGGVRCGPVGHLQNPDDPIDLYAVNAPFDLGNTLEFALEQVGKPYDFRMVAGFVSRRTREARRSLGKWFCSELVYAALEKGGLRLFNQTKPFEVSPDLLKRSTRLIYTKTIRARNGKEFVL